MKGKRRRRGVNMPRDIVEEILVKAPVKSLVRFKAVSKEWRSSIESTCFIEKHTRYQKSLGGRGQGSILSVSGKSRRDYRCLENLLITPCSGGGGSCITQTYPKLNIKSFRPTNHDLKVSEPCDGLFCIYSETRDLGIHLVNPATNSRRMLPESISTSTTLGGFRGSCSLLGIGRENNAVVACPKYKLLWFSMKKSITRCYVFALGSNNWRCVDPPNYPVYSDQPIIHLDGVLYCFGEQMAAHPFQPCISNLLAFDLHTETFRSFSVTPDLGSRDHRELSMCILYHRPCIFKKHPACRNDLVFKIWGLDINKTSWEVMSSIDISCFPPAFGDNRIIIPVATINNYVVLSNRNHHMWLLDGSKIHSLRYTFAASNKKSVSFFETLVSVY